MYSKHKGFTLIELLVVISIISLLSSVVLASLNKARAKSRDSFRKQELVQLRAALELYFSQNGTYPITGVGVWYTSYLPGQDGFSSNGGDWIPGLVASGAIKSLPQDPAGGVSTTADTPHGYCMAAPYIRSFWYVSETGSGYKLTSYCASESETILPSDVFFDPAYPTEGWTVCAGPDCAL